MGVYCYSIRAKTVAITLPDGSKVKANLYSYAYKLSSYWKGDRGYNSYQFMVNNTERNADQVFAKPRSGYVIVGDPERDLADDAVYTDVTASQWFDTERFPGRLVGWLVRDGRGWKVTDRTTWSQGKTLRDGLWLPYKSRSVMVDGKATREEIVGEFGA